MNEKIKMPPFFLKFGKEKNLKDLRDKGHVYFNTFQYFRNQEDKEKKYLLECLLNKVEPDIKKTDYFRRDPKEGLEMQLSGKANFRFSINDKLGNNIVLGKIKEVDATNNSYQSEYQHLFCLYAFSDIYNDLFKIDERMLEFGDWVLVIFNPTSFLERFISKDSSRKLGYVNYYEVNTIKENRSVFDKEDIFKYQSEFRLTTNINDGQIIEIGNINDISVLIPTEALYDTISIRNE